MKARAFAKFFVVAAIPTVIIVTVAFPVDEPYRALLGKLPTIGIAYLGMAGLFAILAGISHFYLRQRALPRRSVGGSGGGGAAAAFALAFGGFYILGVLRSGGAALNADNVAVFATGYVLTLGFYAIALMLSDQR